VRYITGKKYLGISAQQIGLLRPFYGKCRSSALFAVPLCKTYAARMVTACCHQEQPGDMMKSLTDNRKMTFIHTTSI
jgi:hypothetical protein